MNTMSRYRMEFAFNLLGMEPTEFKNWCTDMLDGLNAVDGVHDADTISKLSLRWVVFSFIVTGDSPIDALAYAAPALWYAAGRAGYVDEFPEISTPVLVTL